MAERSGSGRATSSLQTPPHRLEKIGQGITTAARESSHRYEHHTGKRQVPELTDRLRNRHDLRAVKRQVAQRPDDGMDLLHDVERDCDDATCVLTHSHAPATTVQNIQEHPAKGANSQRGLLKWRTD